MTVGQRIIEALREALAFAKGEANGCVVHEPTTLQAKLDALPAPRRSRIEAEAERLAASTVSEYRESGK